MSLSLNPSNSPLSSGFGSRQTFSSMDGVNKCEKLEGRGSIQDLSLLNKVVFIGGKTFHPLEGKLAFHEEEGKPYLDFEGSYRLDGEILRGKIAHALTPEERASIVTDAIGQVAVSQKSPQEATNRLSPTFKLDAAQISNNNEVSDFKPIEVGEMSLRSQALDNQILSLWKEWTDAETEEIPGELEELSPIATGSQFLSSYSSMVLVDLPEEQEQKELKKLQEQYPHPQMHFYFYNTKEKFEDSDQVVFRDGQMGRAESSHSATTGDGLFYLLKNTYGTRLAEVAFQRYGLSQDLPVTWKDVKAALIGVSLHVQSSDLKLLFEQLKNGETEMLCAHYVSARDQEAICMANRFEELDGNQMKLLLDAFRTLPFEKDQNVKKGPVTDVLFEGKSFKSAQVTKYCYDQMGLCTLEMLKDVNTDPDTLSLALSEHVNKEIIYQEIAKGTIIPLFDSKGELAYFEVDSMRNEHDGLVVGVLRQISHSEVTRDNPFQICIAFRGTDSIQGWNRNFDPTGVGRKTYEKEETAILARIQEALEKSSGDYTSIEIGGHSLAGADSQRNQVTLVHHLAEINISKVLFYMLDKVSKGGSGYNQIQAVELLQEIPDLSTLVLHVHTFADDVNQSSSDKMDKLYDWMVDHNGEFKKSFKEGCQKILEELNAASQVQLRCAQVIAETLKSSNREKALQDAIKKGDSSLCEVEKLAAVELKKVTAQSTPLNADLVAHYEASAAFYKRLHAEGEKLLPRKSLLNYFSNQPVLNKEQFEKLKTLFASRKAFDKIVKINTCNWNSPALEKDMNEKYKAGIQVLECMTSDLEVSFTYGRYREDIVQETGEVFIGYGVRSPILEKCIIELSNDKGNKDLGVIGPHTAKSFTYSVQGKFKKRALHEKELEEYLGKNWFWKEEQSSVIKWYADYLRRGVQLFNQAVWVKPMARVLSTFFADQRKLLQAKEGNLSL